MKPDLYIRQIFYAEEHRKSLDPDFIAWNNTGLYSPFLENHVIARLMPYAPKADYIGCVSWKFYSKTGYTYDTLKDRISKNEGVQAFSFWGDKKNVNVWKQAENWHKGIIEIAEIIFPAIGIDIHPTKLQTPVIWQNHFIATPEVYQDYVKTFLIPAMIEMRINPDLVEKLNADSNYQKKLLSSPAGEQARANCLNNFGKPYYTMHPFVCERFFSSYLALHPEITFKSI